MASAKTLLTKEKRNANGYTDIDSFMKKSRGRPKKRLSADVAQTSKKDETIENQNQFITKRAKKYGKLKKLLTKPCPLWKKENETIAGAEAEKKGRRTIGLKGENGKRLAKVTRD